MAKTGFYQTNPVVEEIEGSLVETHTDTSDHDDNAKSSFYSNNQEYEAVQTLTGFQGDIEAAVEAAEAAQAAAEAAQAAASVSAAAAQTAETNAETAETNAETAEANAETAEFNAGVQADAAAASATAAAASAAAAAASAVLAAESEFAADASADAAATSQSAAGDSAIAALASQTAAALSAASADESEAEAEQAVADAQTIYDLIADLPTTNFLGLLDTPDTYTGSENLYVRVNGSGTALVFDDVAATFLQLTDTPDDYTGHALKLVRVNAGETALEFFTGAFTADAISFTPAGSLASTDVQAALEELDSEKQPLDSDLTAIAALSTTAYGRSLLTLANATALAAEVDSFFLTPTEGNAAYQPLDADLTAIAALTTTSYGRSLLELADETALEALLDTLPNLVSIQGRTVTLADAGADAILGWDDSASAYQNLSAADVRTAISVYSQAEIIAGYQPLDADLTSWAGVTRAAGFDTFVATPSQANFMSLITDETFVVDADIGVTVQAYDADLTTWAGLTPSANAQSLVTAANYAAMRALLDLEAGTDFYSIAAADAAFQPLDGDLTSIAALATAAAGRSLLTLADPNLDAIPFWDDSAGATKWTALADLNTEATPAAGDYLLLIDSGGNLLKVNWDELPGAAGADNLGNHTAEQDLDMANFDILNMGYMEFDEMAAPGAGGANTVRLYAKDDGGGNTQLCAIGAGGTEVVICTLS